MRYLVAIMAVALTAPGCGTDSADSPGGPADAGQTQPDARAGTTDASAHTDAAPGADAGTSPLADPAMPGSVPWSQSSETIHVGDQTIPLTLYVPDPAGAYPIIVFTHGFMLEPSLYASYGEQLASWGYVVVMPQLPGSALAPKTHRELADLLAGVLDWIDDAATAGGALADHADTTHLGLAGHSMGGKVSLLVATEDARVKAVFGVDPVDTGAPFGNDPVGYPSVTPELMGQITVPLVLLGETVNATASFGQACAPADNNFQQYYDAAQSPAVSIDVAGANHMSFLDDPNCGLTCSVCSAGSDDPAVTRKLTRKYMTAFFEMSLRGDDRYRSYLAGVPMQADIDAELVSSVHKNGL